jgi:hypothetical protein
MGSRLTALFFLFLSGLACCTKRADIYHTTFTKADSVTDSYLSLQDSVLRRWNIMIYDDNQKIKALRYLLHELQVTSSKDSISLYEEKLDRLKEMRYDQESMADQTVIEQYDRTSQKITSELISIAEARSEFGYNTTLQKLVQEIRIVDQRMSLLRAEYDAITKKFNAFLQANKVYLSDIAKRDSLEPRPLFRSTLSD